MPSQARYFALLTNNKMGHRGKDSSFEKRQLVIFHHARGKSYHQIANMLQMKLADIVKQFWDKDRLESHPHPGS